MVKLETRAMDERMRFVVAAEAGEDSITALCDRFGFSCKTGHKWLKRYREEGIDGLANRSRAPHNPARTVTIELAERCLALRAAHPTWGPVKVRGHLERRHPEMQWP